MGHDTRIKSIYTKKQQERINEYYEKTSYINKLLDDYSLMYGRKFPNREDRECVRGLNDIEYVVCLIGDAHFFINKALNELVLYEFGVGEFEKRIVYSGRFFLSNSFFYTIGSWERVINILSIFNKIDFDNDMKKNTFSRLHKKLRKNSDFISTNAYKIMNNLKEKGKFGEVDNRRKSNDHDISNHIRIMTEIFNNEQFKEGYNYDIELKDICNDILDNIEAVFIILEEYILILKDKVIDNDEQIVVQTMLKKAYETDYEGISSKMSRKIPLQQNKELKTLYDNVVYVLNTIVERSEEVGFCMLIDKNEELKEINEYFADIIFRLHEVSRCLIDFGNCLNGTINSVYPFPDFVINEQYFIYAAIYRVYACFDKLGKVIAKLYRIDELSKYYYFEDVANKIGEKYELGNVPLMQVIKEQLKSDDFIELIQYRNSIFHLIRPGSINGDEGIKFHESNLVFLAYYNCKSILSIFKQLYAEMNKKYM